MIIGLIVTMIVASISAGSALAAPPANDNIADATVLTSFPYSESINTTEATIEPDDPSTCIGRYKSIWYTYAPTSDANLEVSATTDWDHYVALTIYRAINGNLEQLSCTAYYQVTTSLAVTAGETYYFELMVWNAYDFQFDGWDATLSITQVYRPPNNDFANATVITGLPFSDSVDTNYADTELGEPYSCGWPGRSIWYSFIPETSGSFTAESNWGTTLGVFQGSDINNLQTLACASDWYQPRATLWLNSGTIYYFQVYLNIDYWWWGYNVSFNFYPTPAPQANFSYWPGDPCKFDNLQLNNESYDPVAAGIQTCAWDFGDGSNSTDCSPTQTFGVDGDYIVQLTVGTPDGRSASTSQTVQVRTHDIGITRFEVPNSARVGQTKQINVYVKNLYYPETVLVELYKVTANGDVWVGSLNQFMPVRPANRAQLFTFAYTFSNEDASVGKVTFKVVTTIINARDAFPTDNELISFATKVSR